jgi:hypothetical protein
LAQDGRRLMGLVFQRAVPQRQQILIQIKLLVIDEITQPQSMLTGQFEFIIIKF